MAENSRTLNKERERYWKVTPPAPQYNYLYNYVVWQGYAVSERMRHPEDRRYIAIL